MWINREISNFLDDNKDPIQIFRGLRQCGKTSLALKLNPDFKELSLDDPALRDLARRDPELFLKQFEGEKLFIDEAQYAPELFPSLKRKVDLYKRTKNPPYETIIRLAGSNQILMDKAVKESLAGRASYFDLNTLSVSEILNFKKQSIQKILYQGGWPEIYSDEKKQVKKYLDDYINSYIERDIVLTAGIQKSREFLTCLQLLAGRVGNILDLSKLGRECGVDSNTIKSWLSILEKMSVIFLIKPFSHNLSKRLTKAPKVYFLDTGLACRLQGWSSPEPILTSPQQGGLFENLVFSEIYKADKNFNLGLKIYHWRSKEGEEVDFLLQLSNQRFLFIEAKVSKVGVIKYENYPEVRKVFKDSLPEFIQCIQEGDHVLNNVVPIAFLKDKLLKKTELETGEASL